MLGPFVIRIGEYTFLFYFIVACLFSLGVLSFLFEKNILYGKYKAQYFRSWSAGTMVVESFVYFFFIAKRPKGASFLNPEPFCANAASISLRVLFRDASARWEYQNVNIVVIGGNLCV